MSWFKQFVLSWNLIKEWNKVIVILPKTPLLDFIKQTIEMDCTPNDLFLIQYWFAWSMFEWLLHRFQNFLTYEKEIKDIEKQKEECIKYNVWNSENKGIVKYNMDRLIKFNSNAEKLLKWVTIKEGVFDWGWSIKWENENYYIRNHWFMIHREIFESTFWKVDKEFKDNIKKEVFKKWNTPFILDFFSEMHILWRYSYHSNFLLWIDERYALETQLKLAEFNTKFIKDKLAKLKEYEDYLEDNYEE